MYFFIWGWTVPLNIQDSGFKPQQNCTIFSSSFVFYAAPKVLFSHWMAGARRLKCYLMLSWSSQQLLFLCVPFRPDTNSWAKLLRQASKELLPGDGRPREGGVDLWHGLLQRSRCVCVCGTVCVCVSAISNSACHSNRSKGHGPPQLCVHKLHHLPLHWSIVAGLFVQSRGFGWRPIRYVSVRYSFLAWTHCSQQPTVSESRLWRPDVLSHEWRGPPAELLQLLHILIVARLAGVVKLGPGSRPPLLWSTQPGSAAEAVLPAPLSQLPHTQGGQSQTDSPPLPPEPPSHFPL